MPKKNRGGEGELLDKIKQLQELIINYTISYKMQVENLISELTEKKENLISELTELTEKQLDMQHKISDKKSLIKMIELGIKDANEIIMQHKDVEEEKLTDEEDVEDVEEVEEEKENYIYRIKKKREGGRKLQVKKIRKLKKYTKQN